MADVFGQLKKAFEGGKDFVGILSAYGIPLAAVWITGIIIGTVLGVLLLGGALGSVVGTPSGMGYQLNIGEILSKMIIGIGVLMIVGLYLNAWLGGVAISQSANYTKSSKFLPSIDTTINNIFSPLTKRIFLSTMVWTIVGAIVWFIALAVGGTVNNGLLTVGLMVIVGVLIGMIAFAISPAAYASRGYGEAIGKTFSLAKDNLGYVVVSLFAMLVLMLAAGIVLSILASVLNGLQCLGVLLLLAIEVVVGAYLLYFATMLQAGLI